jgi:hypothetical protein
MQNIQDGCHCKINFSLEPYWKYQHFLLINFKLDHNLQRIMDNLLTSNHHHLQRIVGKQLIVVETRQHLCYQYNRLPSEDHNLRNHHGDTPLMVACRLYYIRWLIFIFSQVLIIIFVITMVIHRNLLTSNHHLLQRIVGNLLTSNHHHLQRIVVNLLKNNHHNLQRIMDTLLVFLLSVRLSSQKFVHSILFYILNFLNSLLTYYHMNIFILLLKFEATLVV